MERRDAEAMTVTELFHVLWGRAVGTEGYDKKLWIEMERRLLAARVVTKP